MVYIAYVGLRHMFFEKFKPNLIHFSDRSPLRNVTTRALFKRTKRFLMFSTIGIFVAVFSYVALFLLISVWHVAPGWSYAIQAVASIELSYWLNNRYTWGDQPSGAFWRKLAMFNLTRVITIPPSQWLFLVLVGMGSHYLVANTITIFIGTIVNYIICHYSIFRIPVARTQKQVTNA